MKARWLIGIILVLGACEPTIPFNVNLIPLLDPSQLDRTIAPEGGSVTISASSPSIPPFQLSQIPLHDVRIPLDISGVIPESSIVSASVQITIITTIESDPASLGVSGSSNAAVYIAPAGSSLFEEVYRVPVGVLQIGDGEESTLTGGLTPQQLSVLEGRELLVGLEFSDIALTLTVDPQVDTEFFGIGYSCTNLRIRGSVKG